MIATALRWMRAKYDALRKAVSSPIDPKIPESDNDAAEARRKFSDSFNSFSEFFSNLAKSFNENTQLQRFISVGESFRKSGYFAGQWGIHEPKIGEIAEMQVRITKSLIDEECLSNQRRLNSQVEILKTIKANAERDYNAKNAYYEKLNRAYQYNHRQFSLLLGFIYGFFSLVLVLADIPLALELTRRGFNLKTDPNNAISDLFLFGTQEGFVSHFIKVLASNWEVVLFATGVAFCTIYIKIFYDDFIGVPLENLIKKASESPTADYEEFYRAQTDRPTDNGPEGALEEALPNKKKITDRFNRLWWFRFLVKLLVLIVLFSTILVLGYFRYSVVAVERVVDIPAYVTFFTYSLLTLIFPIISGICASLSLNSFHNWIERRKAEKKNSDAREAVVKATDEFRVKEEEKERNSSFINWLSDPKTIDQLKDYLIRCYESGFKFGYLYPEWTFGGDLFTRAEALRNRNLTDPTVSINGFNSNKSAQLTQAAINQP